MRRYDNPWRVSCDNFTPPSRTPWGGRKIPDKYKAGLELADSRRSFFCVGESWEISTDDQFPSLFRDGSTLASAIAENPIKALGPQVAAESSGLPLLVKWIDARESLSVQVHPSDDDPSLSARQCGKREAWLIVDCDPGAGIYVGLAPGVTASELRSAALSGSVLTPLLNFVTVQPGDAFDIEPGTVHAIGAGVCLIEPQTVVPGRSGVTYRFWDWNRRYDAQGHLDPTGLPRELHVEQSLAAIREYGGTRTQKNVVCTPGFDAGMVYGSSVKRFDNRHGFVLTLCKGIVRVGNETYRQGESFFCPAAYGEEVEIELEDGLYAWAQPKPTLEKGDRLA